MFFTNVLKDRHLVFYGLGTSRAIFSYLCAVKLFVLLTDNHDPLFVVRAEIFADTKYDGNVKRKWDGGDGEPRDANYGYSPYVAVTLILCVRGASLKKTERETSI